MSEEHPVETERGFGTGLRAQLAKRQEESSEAAEVQPVPAQAAQIRAVEVEVRAADGATFAELESLRHELSSALTREHELRTTLESRLAAEQGQPAFTADLEQRQAVLAERERELAMQAASDGVGNTERGYIQTEATQLSTEVDRIANATEFNGTSLLNTTATSLTISNDSPSSCTSK